MEKVDTIFLDNQNKLKKLLEGVNTKGDYKLLFMEIQQVGDQIWNWKVLQCLEVEINKFSRHIQSKCG